MQKRRLKQLLYSSEVRISGIIANGIVNKTPKAIIFRNMKKEIAYVSRYLGLDDREKNEMWIAGTELYSKISKETFRDMRISERKFGKKEDYEEYLSFRKDSVYESVHKYLPELEKTKNSIADTVEYRVKLEEKRQILFSDTIFYVCNWFSDCAKDHIPFQGKIYCKENWEEMCDDIDEKRIRAYIRRNKVLTVESVVNERPWLTTRRNCRHKLYPISVEEVLGSSVSDILKRHDLRHKHENEYNMVLTREKLTYIGYYERLKALTYMRKLFNCKKLDEDIKRTRELMQKWGLLARKNK